MHFVKCVVFFSKKEKEIVCRNVMLHFFQVALNLSLAGLIFSTVDQQEIIVLKITQEF